MNICYWSPHISDKVATVKAVLNSAKSIVKYDKDKRNISIINAVGEWNNFRDVIKSAGIELINFTGSITLYDNLLKDSYIKSRISYIFIFIFSFFKLFFFLKKKKPNYLIIHLITSLPLTLSILFKFDTRFILRISGLPKLNFFRKFLWKIASKNIYKIICPTQQTYADMLDFQIFDKNQLCTIYDPIISPSEIIQTQKLNPIQDDFIINNKKKYVLAIGRLSRQKNFSFLIKSFSSIVRNFPNLKLVILGEGEEKTKLEKLIVDYNLEKFVFIYGYKKNIFYFLENAYCFILSSLWEDPGFVLIESAYSGTLILSSDCRNGPKEILNNEDRGYIFESNNSDSFIYKFNKLTKEEKSHGEKVILAKKFSRNFSFFNHYNKISKILI